MITPEIAGSMVLVSGSADAERHFAAQLLKDAGYQVVESDSRLAAADEARARRFAVFVCVLSGQELDPLTEIRRLRALIGTDAPFILLTPADFNHTQAMCELPEGLVDFMAQPVDPVMFCAKVKMFLDIASRIMRLRARLKEVETQDGALHDTLTGLPMHALMIDRAEQAIRQAERCAGRVALAAIALDEFADVCETLGATSGDELLRQVALRLTGSLRRGDTVARIGVDEFAVVLACDTLDGVQSVSARLDRAIAEAFPVGGHRITVGGSIGVAMFPDHGRGIDGLLERAVKAMNVARKERMGHVVYDPIAHNAVEDSLPTTMFEARDLRVVNGN